MSNTTSFIIVLAGIILFLISCESTTSTDTASEVDPYASSQEIYQKSCASCHGVKIAAFADRKWEYGSEKDSIVEVISHGIKDEEHPAMDSVYTPEEISALADYILETKKKVDYYQFEDREDSDGIFAARDYKLQLDTVATDMISPWGMAFLPDGGLLITDKSGLMYRVSDDGSKTKMEGVPEVHYKGQGGLLDVKLHPDFEENQWVYLSYSVSKMEGEEEMGTTVVSRARLQGNKLVDSEIVFEALPYFSTGHHYGSRMEFGPDGKLYLSVGDRGKRDENPQALDRYQGKIHRINEDGSIPSDNPFINQDNAIASIFSYGHRNPQGMDIHPQTGEVWIHEHGPRGGDEINIVRKGLNYGWPVISYGINYNGTTFTDKVEKDGMEQPVYYWVPSIGPCGMVFVTGDKYPAWEGDLLVGSLKYQFLSRVILDGNEVVEEESLLKKVGRVRSVEMGPDGYVYVGVEGSPGFVARLIPIDN